MNKVTRWVFCYVVKKGFFAQKRPNLAQNWQFWSIWARQCRLIQCPVGGSVGGCGARAVSRKTPIYFIPLLMCPGQLKMTCTNIFVIMYIICIFKVLLDVRGLGD